MADRITADTLGEVSVPEDAYYGAQTQRAVRNFPVSGLRLSPAFIRAQAIIKRSAALANMACGVLDEKIGNALVEAADEVVAGRFANQFVVDVFQAGAGTSQNMNMNEVLASRATELLGGARGDTSVVHPNDHANMSQSTNDTIHTAIHIAGLCQIRDRLLPALADLDEALTERANAFDSVVKMGRTHMQDAVPIRLGQEFSAYANMIQRARRRIGRACEALTELPIGGTAVGTGLNAPAEYVPHVMRYICESTGQGFQPAANRFEAMQSLDAVVEVMGALRVLVTGLRKICGDLILLSSGPRAGLGEIKLRPVQPGSSIMPGKVNPVLPEMLSMVCFHAMGCDMAVVLAAQAGQLELNVMMPIVAHNFLEEIAVLSGGIAAFTEQCVRHIEANERICRRNAERSTALATALVPTVGYHRAAELASEALETNALVRDLARKHGLASDSELEKLLDVARMTAPNASDGGSEQS